MQKEQDIILQRYLSDNERYADLINGYGFAGKQVIKASDLAESDTQTGYWFRPRNLWNNQKRHRQKYRDLLRKAAFGMNFLIIGIENQKEVHYLMPLRIMNYDGSEYEHQAALLRKKVQKQKGISHAEFLSGFRKSDRLSPCITLVLYFGTNWDGSRDLHGILDFTGIPEELKVFVSNYEIQILEVQKLENTHVFRTDLKQVFDFIRHADNKQKLHELLKNDKAYQSMDEDAYDAAAAFANAGELIDRKKFHMEGGQINMCKALEEMLADERMEGIDEGIEQGLKATIIICKDIGLSKADTQKKIEQNFTISAEKIEKQIEKYY